MLLSYFYTHKEMCMVTTSVPTAWYFRTDHG